MANADDVSELVGRIYDAALDPTLWTPVLGETCRFLGCVSGALNSFDLKRNSLSISASYGYDPHYIELLLDHYIHINPLKAFSLQTKVGDVLSLGDVTDYEEITKTPFWREWARPQGFIDAMEAALEKTPTASAALTVIRHESAGRIDREALDRLRLLFPHFRRALLIGKVIDLKRIEAASFTDVVDGMTAGVFLIDANCNIVYANPAARTMRDGGQLLTPDRSRLGLRDPAADRSLNEAVAAIMAAGESGLGASGAAIPIHSHDEPAHIAHVLPLMSGTRRVAAMGYASVAAVFVRRAELEPAAAFVAMQKVFKLTPNEVRVLEAVVEINGTAAIAKVLGMAESTVKSHLHHIFEKTGAERQADLVRLVAGYASPF